MRTCRIGLCAGLLCFLAPIAAHADEDRLATWSAPPYWLSPAATEEPEPARNSTREPLSARMPLAPGPTALPFTAVFPCRLVDTRAPAFPAPLGGGFLPPATVRSYTLTGVCGLPANAQAVSLNVTVVHPTGPGFITLCPEGGTFPPVSTLNYLGNDVIVNAAVVPLSGTGGISMALGVSGGDVILDTNGYYAPVLTPPTVTSLNTLTGGLTLSQGANISIVPGASSLTIAASVNASSISSGVLGTGFGGTGATTSTSARGNLGAAASGANGDITSLLGLTTPLSVAQGGTGAATASASAYQARVTGACAGGGISTVAPDGTVTCATDTVTAASYGANVITTVDLAGDVGNLNAITIAGDGLPFVAYYDGTNLALKTLKCGNPSCSSGNVIRTVPGPAGKDVSVAAGTDGLPVFSFFDNVNKGLRVGKCGDLACTAPVLTTIAAGGVGTVVGLYNSIFVPADGRPVVSYYLLTLGRLGSIRCGNASCTAGNVAMTFAYTTDFGSYSSVAVGADGLATISFFEAQIGRLGITRCATLGCGGSLNRAPDSAVTTGQETSIAIGVDGLAVVSYRDSTLGTLKILKCGNASCDAGNAITTVDPSAPTGFSSSIAIGSSGFPIVSYTGGSPTLLRVLTCGNAACSSGNVITTPDASSTFLATSLTLAPDGLPVVSYYDETAQHLKILKCGNPTCAPAVRRR